jgi:hypothetical protein
MNVFKIKTLVLLACLVALGCQNLSAQTGALRQNFAHPPAAARPWVYWFWGNGNVTRQGITADLEAMQRVGIGGVLIMDVGTTVGSGEQVQVLTPPGPVTYNSPLWHDMVKFAVGEAARLGLQVNLTNAAGWAGSGGPWITPELSQQELVWTEASVRGPAHFDQVLAQPETHNGYYREVALLAYPTPDAEEISMSDFSPVFTAGGNAPGAGPRILAAPNAPPATPVLLARPGSQPNPWLQVAFAKPFSARTLTVALQGNGAPERSFEADLLSSDDGAHFKLVRHFYAELRGIDIAFDAVTARYFRLVFTKTDRWFPDKFSVLSFTLSPRARIDNLRHETLVERGDIIPRANYPALPPGLAVDSSRQIDLSSRMDASGRLVWDVPPGNWTVLRMGHTADGVRNHPAPVGGAGLECDKLSREAADTHFAALMAKVIAEVGPLAGKTLSMCHIDSWEAGSQNWTPKFREEFKARRGYDLLPYLPAITGMIVDSPEATERFLWDFRQTAAELMSENYSGRIQELCHEHGLKLSIEAYGGSDADNGTYGAGADVPMCEFWRVPKEYRGINYELQPISVGHIYGRPVVASEAFTSNGDERWLGYPGDIKAMGDWAFAMGINRLVFHRYSMQPRLDIKPGMSVGPFGLHYDRNQTWWEESGPWHEYLSRCQTLLQQGLWVADICNLKEEREPNDLGMPLPTGPGLGLLPARPGYNYDSTTAAAVLSRFSARDGRIVLPDGMSYRVLTLADVDTMTPALLQKIRQLVAGGATVIGRKPFKSPSLSGYPACDAQVKSIADELWGNCDGKTVTEHAYGKGRIIWGKTADEVLRAMSVPPDFTYDDAQGGLSLLYAHHQLGGVDFYFVSNKQSRAVAGTAHFRVAGKRPEFWWPETGKTEPVAAYTQQDGITSIPIQLDPAQSVFVVFEPGRRIPDPVASVALNGVPIISSTAAGPVVVIQNATYGIARDPERTRDARAALQEMLDANHLTQFKVMQVAALAGDPAPGMTKTLTFDYTINGKPHTATGADSETITLAADDRPVERVATLEADAEGNLRIEAWKPGAYEITTASGKTRSVSVPPIPAPDEITGPWQATFPFQKNDVVFDQLTSWSESPLPDAKYFSGTATYHKTFDVPAEMIGTGKRLYLDLGDVEVNAEVTLNGKDMGLLWKAPYRVEITGAVRRGDNSLEIKVTDLWPNRLIGDAHLPADGDREPDGALKWWPKWLVEGKPDPSGRQTFTTYELWKKNDALIPAGLVGPVVLSASQEVPVP